MGRKSTFNEKDAAEIVDRLSKGEPLAVICRSEGMPCDDTVRNWADADPEFSRSIARAREAGFDAIAQRLRQTIRGKTEDEGGESTGDVQRDKAIAEIDLKLLAKWDPKRYGDKVALTGGSEEDAPLQFQNVSNRDRAKAMAALVAKSRTPGE